MAKVKNLIIIISWFISGFGAFAQGTKLDIYNTTTKYNHVRELTGNNDGTEVEKFLHFVGFKKGAPWCAAYVAYVLHEAGVHAIRSAWSPAWFPQSKVIYSRNKQTHRPDTGDVFGIYYPNLKRIGHVGFVIHWGNHNVITDEGNTNDALSREGNGKYRKRRQIRSIYKVSRWIK